jgi:CubicO group peptidase (beta-lactamase class C family)
MFPISRRKFLGLAASANIAALAHLLWPATGYARSDAAKGSDVFRELDQYAADILNRFPVPGFTTGVVRGGALAHTAGFGVMEIGSPKPMKPQTVHCLASVSKAFTGTAIMQLVEAGAIQIDLPLLDYLPYFELKDPRYSQITIRHLLGHASGLPESDPAGVISDWASPEYDAGALERRVRAQKDADYTLSFDPGMGWLYSDLGYDILGDVIHKVSGELFEDYCDAHIFIPLGMSHTTFFKSQVAPGLLSQAHVLDSQGNTVISPYYPYDRKYAPSACVLSNIRDMSTWLLTHLNGGAYKGRRILRAESQAALWQPLTDFGGGWGYGWGWFVGLLGEERMVFSAGGTGGSESDFGLLPAKGIGSLSIGNYMNAYEDPHYVFEYTDWALAKLLASAA